MAIILLGFPPKEYENSYWQFSSVQSLSRVWLFATPWTALCQSSLFITNSQSPSKPTSIESVMPSNHLILCSPLLLLPSIFPSIRIFSNESALHIRWPEYWCLSFSQSFQWTARTDLLLDGLIGSSCSLRDSQESSPTPQFKSINSSVLSFLFQLSHPYITTGKTKDLARQTFVGKVISLLFNMLSGLVKE